MRQQLVVYRQPNGQQNELDPICVEKAETPVRAVLIEQHSSDLSCQVCVFTARQRPGAHLTGEAQDSTGALALLAATYQLLTLPEAVDATPLGSQND